MANQIDSVTVTLNYDGTKWILTDCEMISSDPDAPVGSAANTRTPNQFDPPLVLPTDPLETLVAFEADCLAKAKTQQRIP